MDRRCSVGMPKTIHLAVDWHHSESPRRGRSAVEWLLESANHPPQTYAGSPKSSNRDACRVNREWAFSGETEKLGGGGAAVD